MNKQIVLRTRDESYEYFLRINLDLKNENKFFIKDGNISFHINSYEVDDLYSSSNWQDVFKITRVCKLLTIEVASKQLKIEIEFPDANQTNPYPPFG
jgi:hypothetical protein